jgi:protein-tyrosine phosphatase
VTTREWLKEALLVNRFGGAGGLLRHFAARARVYAGLYRSMETVQWSRVQRLVFVCTGNICRSPYAEVRARSLGLEAASLGLETTPGSHAPASAVKNARARGMDLCPHRSRLFDHDLLGDTDLVVGFEPWQVQMVQNGRHYGNAQLTLAGLWSKPLRPDICDPLGRSDEYFQICYDLIDSSIANMRNRMARASALSPQTSRPGT